MKNIGLLIIVGIELIIGIFSAGATDTPRNDQECGLEFTSIEFNRITVLWNRSCFDDDSSYTLVVNGTSLCEKKNINENYCTEESCQIATRDMGCSANPISGCVPVTFTVTGNTYDKETSGDTIAAPIFSDGDWNLNASVEGTTLTVQWGPLTGDYVSCATHALITATCGTITKDTTADNPDPLSLSTGHLSLDGCQGGDITLVTVTYLSNDVPTERKKTYVGGLNYIAAPDAPAVTNVVGKDTSPTTLSVTWEKPTTPIGAEDVTGYTITASPGGTSVEVDDPDAVTYDLTGLLACLDYTVSVAAKWSGGTGESGSNTGTTGSQAPGNPSNVTSESTKWEISVSWINPNSIYSCPITSYTVTWTPENGSETTADETPSYTITDLTRNKEYTIAVTANAGDKTSSASDQNHRKTKNLYGGDIAGIVCGCLVGVALIIGGIFFGYKKKKLQKEETNKA